MRMRGIFFYGGTLTDGLIFQSSNRFNFIPANQHLMGSHFLAIRGEVLPFLIDYLKAMLGRPGGHPEGGPMHVDGAYSWFRAANPQYRTLLCDPPLAFQRSSRTDIHNNSWYDRCQWSVRSLPFFVKLRIIFYIYNI